MQPLTRRTTVQQNPPRKLLPQPQSTSRRRGAAARPANDAIIAQFRAPFVRLPSQERAGYLDKSCASGPDEAAEAAARKIVDLHAQLSTPPGATSSSRRMTPARPSPPTASCTWFRRASSCLGELEAIIATTVKHVQCLKDQITVLEARLALPRRAPRSSAAPPRKVSRVALAYNRYANTLAEDQMFHVQVYGNCACVTFPLVSTSYLGSNVPCSS